MYMKIKSCLSLEMLTKNKMASTLDPLFLTKKNIYIYFVKNDLLIIKGKKVLKSASIA